MIGTISSNKFQQIQNFKIKIIKLKLILNIFLYNIFNILKVNLKI